MGGQAGTRLGLALALSLALHVSLIWGIAVGPGVPAPVHTMLARLVPQASPPGPAQPSVLRPRDEARADAFSSAKALQREAVVEPNEVSAPTTVAAPTQADESLLPRADVPLLVDPVWHTAAEIDIYPRPLAPVEPIYPESAANLSGEVSLLVKVDEFGTIRDVSVVSAQPAGYFEDAAMQAFKTAHFTPAQRDGQPVRSQIVVRLRFAPQSEANAAR